MQPRHKPCVAVIGSSATSAAVLDIAREVGRQAVHSGLSIVSGGLGGIMDAVSEGAQQAKEALRAAGVQELPQVIAVLPDANKARATPHADIVIPTGMGFARNALVVLAADAAIAIEGGSGTLSEIAFAWQFGRPVAAIAPSGGWASKLANLSLDQKRPDVVYAAETPADAVRFVIERLHL